MTDTIGSQVALRAGASAHDISEQRAELNVKRKSVRVRLVADSAANTDTAEFPLLVVPAHLTGGMMLRSVSYTAAAAVTAVASKRFMFRRVHAGVAAAAAAGIAVDVTSNTDDCDTGAGTLNVKGSGDLTAFVPTAGTLSSTPADLVLAAGDVLTLTVTHFNTGTQLPLGEVEVVLDEL